MTDNTNHTTTTDMNNQSITTKTNNNISTTHNNDTISLKRNQSLSSTTSSKNYDGAPPQHNSQSITNSTTFPASPALSTLTKNTSSSDSCSSAHVHSAAFYGAGGNSSRMNVDDILNKSKFKGAKKRRGRKSSVGVVKSVNGGVKSGGGVNNGSMKLGNKPAAAARKPIQKVKTNNTKVHNTKVHNKQDNGQMERQMRLQRLQQDQLLKQKRKLSSNTNKIMGSVVSGENILKRQSSLDSRTSLDREMENTQDIERLEEKSVTSRGSSSRSSSSKKRARQLSSVKESPGSNKSDPTQQRRSKRAKSAISSYNVTELTKQNSIMSEIEVKNSSSPVAAAASSQSEKIEGAEAQSTEELAEGMEEDYKNIPKEDEPEDEDEPDSVQSALSTLLIKYNSCIGLPSPTSTLSSATKTPTLASSTTTKAATTTWEIVQLLVSTLRYINLLDPKSINTDEYKEVIKGLSNVIQSVHCVKKMVMNRNSVIQSGNIEANQANGDDEEGEADDDEEDSITKVTNYNSKLLSKIQLQIWMRMMIWSLEEVAGWEFLCQIVTLADSKLIKQQGMDDSKGGNKDGKGKKKTKKKKKDKKQQKKATNKSKDMTPRDSLVQDIRQLIELAPYVLPPSMEFAQWMKDTLTLGFRQSIPEYGSELFDHFEIELTAAEPIALKRSDTDTSRRSERSHVSHSPVKDNTTTKGVVTGSSSSSTSPTKNITEKRHKRQQAYFASLAEEENKASAASGSSSIKTDDETATITGSVSTVTSTSRASSKSIREKDDNILLKTSVSLTSTIPSRTSNPFLKGSARGSYVGSHLSSKLSNITSLFREVKAAPKTKPKAKAHQASKKAPPQQQAAATAGVKRKNSLPTQLSVTSVKPATTTTRFKATITEESATSSVPNEPQSKRRRPAVSSLRASSYTARATTNPRAASSSFTVGETPMKRPIIEETPAKKPQPGAVRQRLRLRDDHPYMGNAIVAETPQQPLMRGGSNSGVDHQEDSSFLPTNLWSRQYQHSSGKRRPPQRAGWIDTRHRQQQNGTNNSHLSPVVNLGASGSMNLGFSPMPHQEDMAAVLAKAAKSAASRKRK